MAIGFVQQGTGTAEAGTTIAVTLPATTTAGNFLVLQVSSLPKTVTVSTASSTNAIWTRLVGSNNQINSEIWVTPFCGASTTVTVTLSGSITLGLANVSEWYGVQGYSYTGNSGSSNFTGVGQNPVTASIVVNARDLIVAMAGQIGGLGAVTYSSGFTVLTSPASGQVNAYQLPLTDGTYTCTFTYATVSPTSYETQILALHAGDITDPDSWWGMAPIGALPWGGESGIWSLGTQTIVAKSRIQGTSTATIAAKARIQNTSLQTVFGVARITITTTQTVAAKSRVIGTTNQTITGKARITAITLQTVFGLSRIQISTTKTITAKSRISTGATKTIAAKSNIIGTTSQVIIGKANIIVIITPQTILGQANIFIQEPVSSRRIFIALR